VSTKNQVTLPVHPMRRAGLKPGDVLRAEVLAPGQLLLVRAGDPVSRLAGSMTSVFAGDELQKLRDGWG
jgi:bifunctional DNA-binding transcriptional regulator/antitoxin component of YhaV-PrlF toxin-antitoxin module